MRTAAARIAVVTLLFGSALAGGVSAQRAEPNRALSRLYTEYALSALEEGERSEAETFATTALEFFSENADARHILARSLADRQAETQRVVANLSAALSAGGFRLTDELEARLLLADTYTRTGRADEALEVLTDGAAAGSPNPDVLHRRARALLALDRVEAGEEVALEGRRLHPDDPRFFYLLLRRDPMPGPQAGRWLDENVSDHPAYLESLLYYAARVGDTGRKLELTNRYLILGGEDPRVAVVRAAAASEGGSGLAAEWQRFVGLDGLGHKAAVEDMYETLPAGDVADRARRVLASYGETAVRDADRNGYWEERYLFENGSVTRWQIDENEDGSLEYDIELDDRVPRRLRTSPEGFEISYGSYPEIADVSVVDGELRRVYRVRPGRVTYPILAEELDWGADIPGPAFRFRLTDAPPLVSEELLRRNAFRLEIGPDGGPADRVLSLDEGVVVREVRDGDADGRIDHVISYADGEPASGMRDADGDGRFETAEQYADGELVLLLVDTDNDGRPDYREELAPQQRYAWDYDGDGTIDAQELLVGQGEVLRRFSTDEDGEFELSIRAYREDIPNE